MIRSHKGMTLIEVMISMAILGIVIYGASAIVLGVAKEKKRFVEVSGLEKIVRSITVNIRQQYGNLPGFNPPAKWGTAGYDPYFDNSIAYQTCFRKDGVATDVKNTDCVYRCEYFVLRVVDGRFSKTSDLATLPVNQMYIRITYKAQDREKQYFDSHLLTQTLGL
jgi:prepilin-type N-terminal cleavage/methylation domain-containing protein